MGETRGPGDASDPALARTQTRSMDPEPDAVSMHEGAIAERRAEAIAGRCTGDDRTGDRLSFFRLVSKLGEGGMGVVYAAEDSRLGRTVALKILPPSAVASPEKRRRFLREARAASAVMHPGIAAVFEVGEHAGEVFLAMERVEGRTLRAVLREGRLPVERALAVVRDLARALEHAHRAGVVHRDLKPENVMETPGGAVKILDFGLAKRVGPEAPEGAAAGDVATVEGKILGTPGYMAPEQVRGAEVDARTDIFALGVLLFELLTTELPFRAPSALALLAATERDPALSPSSSNDAVPARVDAIVARCLEKRPADRFATCGELAAALAEALADPPAAEPKRPTPAAAPSLGETNKPGPGARPVGRSAARWGTLVVLVAVAAGALVAWRFARPPEPPAPGGPRRPCLETDRGRTQCGGDGLSAWCDPGGALIACCGQGLVPKGADGICGCAPGGTHVAEARARGCPAVPADTADRYQEAKLRASTAAAECFTPTAKEKWAGGTFAADFFLTPEGEVFGARVERCTIPDEGAQKCALDALRSTRFPPPPAEEAGQKKGFGFVLAGEISPPR